MATKDDVRERRTHGYEGARPDIQQLVPATVRNALELGCSTGALGQALKSRQDMKILGVELLDEYACEARGRLDRVIVADAESFVRAEAPSEAPFDCLIAADVLEHLVDPWDTLRRATAMLAPGAVVIVSLPNVLYWRAIRRVLTSPRWPREDEGIFDRTHLRWFAELDAKELLTQADLVSVVVRPRYWAEGKELAITRLLARTRAAPYLPAQFLATGIRRRSDRSGR